jgi:hypothetical protein
VGECELGGGEAEVELGARVGHLEVVQVLLEQIQHLPPVLLEETLSECSRDTSFDGWSLFQIKSFAHSNYYQQT